MARSLTSPGATETRTDGHQQGREEQPTAATTALVTGEPHCQCRRLVIGRPADRGPLISVLPPDPSLDMHSPNSGDALARCGILLPSGNLIPCMRRVHLLVSMTASLPTRPASPLDSRLPSLTICSICPSANAFGHCGGGSLLQWPTMQATEHTRPTARHPAYPPHSSSHAPDTKSAPHHRACRLPPPPAVALYHVRLRLKALICHLYRGRPLPHGPAASATCPTLRA